MAYRLAWIDTGGCGAGLSEGEYQTADDAKAKAERSAGRPLEWNASRGICRELNTENVVYRVVR